MSEERIPRLENAMATLAEISAQHNERLAAIERSEQLLRELTATHAEMMATQAEMMAAQAELTANMQRRVARLEESYVTVVELLRSQHDGMTELRAAQAHADNRIASLAESQAHSDRKLDALIDIVRGGRYGQSEGS